MELTIIVPHYNSTSSLKKLLGTIPKRDDVEIIVVDDKSEEKEIILYDKIKKTSKLNNIKFLKNKTEKKGAGVCRNIGISHATGKWILFADSDDLFIKGFYKVVEKYFGSNNEVVFFRPYSIEIGTEEKSNRHMVYESILEEYKNKKTQRSELCVRYQFIVPWSKMIRLSLLKEQNILFEEVRASNDVLFSTKVGHYMKCFTVSNEVIYIVTKGFDTLTTNNDEKIYDTRVDVFIRYYNFLKERLSKEEFKLLEIHGLRILYNAFKKKYGIKKVISTYLKLKRNDVMILTPKLYKSLIFWNFKE